MNSDLLMFLEKVGLPTFFCLWFMFRQEKRAERHMELMTRQTALIAALAKVWDVHLDNFLPSGEGKREKEH